MIQIRRREGEKLIELGGGANPMLTPQCRGGQDICVDMRMCHDANGLQLTDFTADFNEKLPITENEFDGLLMRFALEHISWRKVPQFLAECFRILKPNGKAVYIIPNTEAQMQYILSKSEWDGDEGSMLFGDLDYPENSHKSAFSPKTITKFLQEAGFEKIITQPYGELKTDMVVEAFKPGNAQLMPQNASEQGREGVDPSQAVQTPPEASQTVLEPSPLAYDPVKTFDREYFNGGRRVGGYKPFYWDHPSYEIVARHVLARKPKSVLSIGEGRGYILKRIEDAGVEATGIDISNSCYLTRASDHLVKHDLSQTPWPVLGVDLCFSLAFWEHVPEHLLDGMIAEMFGLSERGLHGITFAGEDDGQDQTRVTLKDREWWRNKLPPGHEVLSVNELRGGNLPEDYLKGDGKNKLNIGCAWTMFHHGWVNTDVIDVSQFAGQYGYRFAQMDVRNGIANVNTGTVDLIYSAHMLEHLSYREGLAFLRECRRVIKPDGFMRIIVPDAGKLIGEYAGELFNLSKDYEDGGLLSELGDMNEECANAPTSAVRLWSIVGEHHHALYDAETLCHYLREAGWIPTVTSFRQSECKQILRETIDMLPSISCVVDAKPLLG